ncbi:MFS transporter [Streptomyces sp. MUSC 14]|uniref:MFS transporter n=1 Tax=Streptomyces sp. MUSC 14 TaxID=1354889 RepID=UPI0008F5F709|nr:MFS transporter [Streptomyces sp. MUSC 14]OIJ94729.1 MFS transporter [Streptomyces sp. MUSC 14]
MHAGGLRQGALVPVLVFLGTVVAVISSLGAPLVPTVAAVDHVSLSDAQWSLTVTMLVGAVVTPVMGRLGDGPRRRTAMLAAVATVLVGCVLGALPLGFPVLLVGRALQGVGLGLTPLAIATARDRLTGERARSAVAMLSITTVAGVGLGYPLTGLISQSFGVHAGFWFGAIVSVAALAAGALVLPAATSRRPAPLDALGAVLLGLGLGGVLLVLSEGESWGWSAPGLLALAAGAVLLLAWWVWHELRIAQPLVDLRSLRNRVVLTADVTGLVAGVGMYLLMSLMTRFVQTPSSAGYGFGASITVVGLVLLPFSVASVLSSKVVPALARRTAPVLVLPIGCGLSLLSILVFLFARDRLWESFVVMAIAGLGVGCTFAVLPGLIVGAVPAQETGSAVSFNQVLRYVGYSTGSALSAAVLQAHTTPGHALPAGDGYRTAALIGCAVWVLVAVVTIVLPRHGVAAAPGVTVRVGGVPPARSVRSVDEELLVEESMADATAAEGGAPVHEDGAPR